MNIKTTVESTERDIPLESNKLEEIQDSHIAKYGYSNHRVKNGNTAGEETHRTNIRRQRDKILYTGGFRRLQDKTQVISATLSGDHRTRLTHTLEVEQIATSVASALKLNTDLVSAIALGHDVGHTPFGHAAERKLNKLLRDNGKFHHPIQSVRYLWEKYGDKIIPEIYEGILLHDSDMFEIKKEDVEQQLKYLKRPSYTSVDIKEWVKYDKWLNNFPSTLEAQVVVWADKIGYITHDLEDFHRNYAFVNLKKNNNKIEKELIEILQNIVKTNIECLESFETRDLIRNIISDLIEQSAKNIERYNLDYENISNICKNRYEDENDKNVNEKKKYLNSLIINFSDNCRIAYYNLRKFLDDHYIFSPEVQKSDAKAEIIVEWLFNKLVDNYKIMPLNVRDEIENEIVYEVENSNLFNCKANKDNKNNQEKIDCWNEIENNISTKKRDLESDLVEYIFSNQVEHKNIDKFIIEYCNFNIEIKTCCNTIFENSINKGSIIRDINEYKNIKDNVVSRKVAVYLATMSDSYAESMYRNLIGSRVDFVL